MLSPGLMVVCTFERRMLPGWVCDWWMWLVVWFGMLFVVGRVLFFSVLVVGLVLFCGVVLFWVSVSLLVGVAVVVWLLGEGVVWVAVAFVVVVLGVLVVFVSVSSGEDVGVAIFSDVSFEVFVAAFVGLMIKAVLAFASVAFWLSFVFSLLVSKPSL